MVTQEVTINNEVGLHARPATFFIQKANEFKRGTTITLLADGSDEKEAVAALSELVSGNFGE